MSNIKRFEFPEYIVKHIRKLKQQVVAESGNPNDEFHLGKILLTSMQNNPDSVNQIDGNIGETKTNETVVRQSKKLAQSLKTWGLKPNDVIGLMTSMHLNTYIPVYAGWCLGVPVEPIDISVKLQELKILLNIGKPKVIFCLSRMVTDIRQALKEIGLQSIIITFDEKHTEADFLYDEFVDTYSKGYESFELVPESEDNLALILTTSGSTGLPKGVMMSQRNFVAQFEMLGAQFTVNLDTDIDGAIVLNVSGPHWITAYLQLLGCLIYNIPYLSSSGIFTPSHVCDLINKYKPSFTFMSPSLASSLLKHSKQYHCDFSCFRNINIGGSVIPSQLISSLQNVIPNGNVRNIYGLSESGYVICHTGSSPIGRAFASFEYKVVDPATGAEVGPNNTGELWIKGPGITKGYYNDPVSTKDSFSEDGWFKTGDLITYNDEGQFFYMDRFKMLFKYKNYQISPVEVENVIRSHPSVEGVVVVGAKDPENGELPTACVVVKPDYKPNAKEIIEEVKNKLSDYKQLRGGVLFVSNLPVSSNGKPDRKQTYQIMLSNIDKIIKE